MNKTELVALVAERSGMTKKDTERVVSTLFDTIAAQLRDGEKVQITGFGNFEIKEREARVGRNPRTKEAVQIPACKSPVFKASNTLKDKIAK
jgi:DNA-binding protein HU-beta